MNKKSNVKRWIERSLYFKIVDWLGEREIIAVNGPRQSGKTTLLLKIQEKLQDKKTVFVNFEDTSQLEAFNKSPQDFISLNLQGEERAYFFFDEFQYVENGGKILKLLFDQFPQVKFIISGSSSLKIRQIASFLVGRVVFFELYPLSFAEFLSYYNPIMFELWQGFNDGFRQFLQGKRTKFPKFIYEDRLESAFEEYMIFGGYPAIATATSDKKKEKLHGLIETYIEKDIIKYLQIDNFLEFKNFVKVLAAQVGNLINYSSLSQDTALSFKEIKSFLGILEETFVIKLVPPYFSNRVTEIRKSPKGYFLDSGLRNALLLDFRELAWRENKGALIENFVFQNLFFDQESNHLSFWRTKQGAEVDFVLRWQNEVIPIEVKSQGLKKASLSRSFLSFLKNYRVNRAVVLNKDYTGVISRGETKILFLPFYFV